MTQPYSPGSGGRITSDGARLSSPSNSSIVAIAASRRACASGGRRSSSSEACSAERRSSSANAARPGAASEMSCARPSAGERLRETMPGGLEAREHAAEMPRVERERRAASAEAVVSGTCPSS